MPEYQLRISGARPFFAELPYYVWGRVNYDSDGDCSTPLDRAWTKMELTNRDTDESLEVWSRGDEWTVSGPDPAAARLTYFLANRCDAQIIGREPGAHLEDWDHGAVATDFTWVGRWIMDAVLRNDPRAVEPCVAWLRDGTTSDSQSAALTYALQRLTGLTYGSDAEWVAWYEQGGRKQYPEPSIDAWYDDLKVIHGE